MSEEQLKAFIAKVQGDKSLQDQLNAEDADVLSIANAAGFSISTEDLNAYRINLSDEELEGMSGGDEAPCIWSIFTKYLGTCYSCGASDC